MKNYVLLLLLVVVIILSGCIGQPEVSTVRYKNDIITVEEYSVDTLNPYAGTTMTISFSIKNNGDKPVEWSEVNFFDIPSFTVVELYCERGKKDENKCTFKDEKEDNVLKAEKLDIYDVRKVSLTLKAPSKETILSPKKFTISYSISYSYSGSREAHIPIIDGTTKKTPLSRFTQSEPTYGPIQVDFTPPIGRETKEDSRVITEHFGIIGKPFKVELNFRHVGSSSLGKIEKVAIPRENVRFDLKDTLERAKDETGKDFPCNFPGVATAEEVSKEINVPSELFCNLKSKPSTLPEVVGIIFVDYSYTYQYIRTETITVQPMPTE